MISVRASRTTSLKAESSDSQVGTEPKNRTDSPVTGLNTIDSEFRNAQLALSRFLIAFVVYNIGRNLVTVWIATADWPSSLGRFMLVALKVCASLIPLSAIWRVPNRSIRYVYLSAVLLAIGIQSCRVLGLDLMSIRPMLRTLDTVVMLGLVFTVVSLISQRADAKRKKEEDFLDALSLRTSGRVGEDFLVHLVNGLVRLLDVEHAYVAEYREDGTREIVASSCRNTQIDLAKLLDTVARGEKWLGSGLCVTTIPLASLSSEPVKAEQENELGCIILVHNRKFSMTTQQEAALRVFGGRAAAELERRQLDATNASLESQMRHVQKLESLGVMAGGIAHDFNNLLTAIRSNATVLVDSVEIDQQSFERLTGIQLAVDRGRSLCDSLLAYSGKYVTHNGIVDVNSLLTQLVTVVHASSPEKKFDLDLCTDSTLVWGDDGQLCQVFLNLMKNAQEATEGFSRNLRLTSRVRVERSKREPRSGDSLGTLLVEVCDNGHGIDADILNRVFDPFFSTKGVGRGLGLAAVLGIVRQHGGDIQVESKPGIGTKFSVTLPLTSQRPPGSRETQPQSESRSSTSDIEVLLVDDDELVRDSLEVQLLHMGMRVTALSDGDEAIRLFAVRGDVFDIAIVDQTMCGLSGMDTIRRLREMGLTSKVILTSGYSPQGLGGLPEDLGFLRKPYTKSDLLEVTALGERERRSHSSLT